MMKRYIVKYGKKEEIFLEGNIVKAVEFAEKKAETGLNTSVWVEENGVVAKEPFFHCTWEI